MPPVKAGNTIMVSNGTAQQAAATSAEAIAPGNASRRLICVSNCTGRDGGWILSGVPGVSGGVAGSSSGTFTRIWGARHSGQKGTPSSIGEPHFQHVRSTT